MQACSVSVGSKLPVNTALIPNGRPSVPTLQLQSVCVCSALLGKARYVCFHVYGLGWGFEVLLGLLKSYSRLL